MKRIPRLSQGGALTQSQWDRVAGILDANFRECIIQPGVGYRVRPSPGGPTLVIKEGGGFGSPVETKPLQIILSSETSGDTTHDYLSLYPGTVGGIYPKVDDKFLWMMPPDGAGGFLEHPRMEIELPEAAGDPPLFVWLKAKCLTGVVVEVTCETGATVPENTVEYGYVRLGYINSDGTVYQEAYGPISYFLAFALDPSNPIGHEFVAR